MPVERDPHIEQHRGRNADVLITGQNVDRKPEHGSGEHEPGRPAEHMPIATKQRGIDQKFGEEWLRQAESGGKEADGENQDQAPGVGPQEGLDAAVIGP